jgi:phosphoribosylanthranilate isomerase
VSTVKVKICGVTRAEDARAAAEAGADAIGINFWPGSKRFVTLADAPVIAAAAPARVLVVGVFVDAERAVIERAIREMPLGAIQLHGGEPPDACTGFGVPVIKAIAAREGVALAALAASYPVDYVLLDADARGRHGGTGESFPLELAVDVAPGRLFLAGGLRPETVADAVRRVRPYAVDVASGVESAPGVKDRAKIEELIRNAKAA